MPASRPALRRLLLACALFVVSVFASRVGAAETSLPQFLGFISTPAGGAQFMVRWQSADGVAYQGWLRLNQRAGDFTLVEFDAKGEILSVADPQGRPHPLRLPAGKVRNDELTEEEFADLFRFMLQGADHSAAPILSREKARAFLLKHIARVPVPADVEIVLDLEGATVSPEMKSGWAQHRTDARANGRLLLALRVDGKTELHDFPQRPYLLPEPMTRNLLESDWDEISLLDATNSLKRRAARRSK